MKRLVSLSTLAVLLLMCVACSPNNTVRLLYKPAESATLPAPGAPSVTVVQFEDKRPHPQMGVRRDGSSFVSTSPVAEWVSRSLADELARQGLQVSFATSITQARSGHPAYIVTGVLEETWLAQSSATDIAVNMRATVTLASRKGRELTEALSASQNKSGFLSSTTTEQLLLDTVQELVKPAVRKIDQIITKR